MGVGLKNCTCLSRSIGKRGSFERKFDGGRRQIGLLLNKRKFSNETAGFLRKGPFSRFRFLKVPRITSKRLADSFSLSFFIWCQTLLWYVLACCHCSLLGLLAQLQTHATSVCSQKSPQANFNLGPAPACYRHVQVQVETFLCSQKWPQANIKLGPAPACNRQVQVQLNIWPRLASRGQLESEHITARSPKMRAA